MNPKIKNLFKIQNYRKPVCRALWVNPTEEERRRGFPERRIVHSLFFTSPFSVRFRRIGIRLGEGYMKCGADPMTDWIQGFRILILENGEWREARSYSGFKRPLAEETVWLEDLKIEATALIFEIRESGVDGGWVCWNLAMSGLVAEVESDSLEEIDPPPMSLFETTRVARLPKSKDLSAWVEGGNVRFSTPEYEIGFRLQHPSLSYFEPKGLIPNLRLNNHLKNARVFLIFGNNFELGTSMAQGPRLHAWNQAQSMGYYLCGTSGKVSVVGNHLSYQMVVPETKQVVDLDWEMRPDRFILRVNRTVGKTHRALFDSVWSIVLDSSVTPATTIQQALQTPGEVGRVPMPFLWHFPRSGNFRIDSQKGSVWKYDSIRPLLANAGEIHLGNKSQAEGDYLVEKGKYGDEIQFVKEHLKVSSKLHKRTSKNESVFAAIERCAPTAFSYRPDTVALSNNANSIHCYFCLEAWVDLMRSFPKIGSTETKLLVRDTLERWLEGAPSYASGGENGGKGFYEEHYLHSITATLYALSEYMKENLKEEWTQRYLPKAMDKLSFLKNLDVDSDGLIESVHRRGVSGEGQWSTNWWDVISFGWKDAFANAYIYPMLLNFEKIHASLGDHPRARTFSNDAKQFKKSYLQTFWNSKNGWLAGWKCKEGKLHDYAFLFVNGSAVKYGILEGARAKSAITKLYRELDSHAICYRYGIPGNLRPVPDADQAHSTKNRAFGCYENGGLTHSQSKHFIGAMYQVGLVREADRILKELCQGLAEGEVLGGVGSGVDWRFWNGTPCGYEGILVDQFGILSVAQKRFAIQL